MARSYFPGANWEPFVYQGNTYNLSHLNEYEFTVEDTTGATRRIAVTFADHCFTESAKLGEDPSLAYPSGERNLRSFSFQRYYLSLGLTGHIEQAASGKVWTVDGGNFAALPLLDQSGRQVLYGIIFSLERVKNLLIHLHMRIKSAYPIDNDIITFGSVRFRHLVALEMKGKNPGRITGQRRKAP